MAAILTIAKRLTRTQHFKLSLSRLLQPTVSGSLSSPSVKVTSFFLAIHQTVSVHSQAPNHFTLFLSLHGFCAQIITDPFDFPKPENRTLDPQEPGVIDLIRRVAHLESEAEAIASLEESDIELNNDVLYSVIWALRDEWRLAFLALKWGEKCTCKEKKACDLMVWILGNHQKFNIAWCLIRDMFHCSMDTRKAMFTMIDRYAAANEPNGAIRTFHIMDKFRLTPDEEAFHGLLYALCKHRNIEEAEEFMLANRKLFPLDVEGFNFILKGWCNIWVDVSEAKRIWREMGNYCITPNAVSYTHMISCFSKVGNIFDSLRLYDEMKKRGWVPGMEVYNSLVYVLTRENCFDEALKLLEKMKEKGLKPDSVTYNSMIRPLCESNKLEEARNMLASMISENLSPTVDTFHAFLEAVGFDQTLEVLNRMNIAGLGPKGDTFLLLLGKFFKVKQPENALKVWAEMGSFEVVADSALYTSLVHGLVTCGWLVKAREFYSDMKSKGFLGDPKIQKVLQEPVPNNSDKRGRQMRPVRKRQPVNPQEVKSRRCNEGQHQSRTKKESNNNLILNSGQMINKSSFL